MNKSIKVILIIMAFIVAIIIGLYLYNYFSKRAEVGRFSGYYENLAKQCLQKSSYECCISSVKNMEQGNYKLKPETGCPEGYNKNGLKCIDAFTWCEPITQ